MSIKVRVELSQMVSSVSRALDLMHPTVTGHHRRVATVAAALARGLGLSRSVQADVVLAASLHDGLQQQRADDDLGPP